MTTWADVTSTLLARWPAQRWEREQAAAYIRELQSDCLSPETAMTGLRAATGAFVPSVGEVTAAARKVSDAGLPTLDEVMLLIERFNYGPAGRDVLTGAHPVAAAFVASNGRTWHGAPLLGDEGKWNRKEIAGRWAAHCETTEDRQVAITAGGRGNGELTRLDPLHSLGTGDE